MTRRSCNTVNPLDSLRLTSSTRPGESQTFKMEEVRGKDCTMDFLETLLQKECDLYFPPKDYFTANAAHNTSETVSEVWRRKLCEWCYEVVDHFQFDREVVSIALNYLDRSVANWSEPTSSSPKETMISKREYQLLTVTSLYMAIKLHGETDSVDGPRRKLKIDAFYELSRKQFDVATIERTERHILSVLSWNVNPPTCLKFIHTLLLLCPKWDGAHSSTHSNVIGGIYDVARYLTELAVCQSEFTFTCKTSVTAYGSVLCAMEALQATLPLPYPVRVAFLNNIAQATDMVAGDADVVRVCQMLKSLCPNMFQLPVEAPSQHGKTSPVCVIEEQNQQKQRVTYTRRNKRSREEDWSAPSRSM